MGTLAAIVVIVIGLWAGGAFDRGAEADGNFVLEESGVFDQPSDEINPDVSGRQIADIDLLDVDGNPVSLRSFAGEPLVVNFWFSRCAPCRRELRDFAQVHADLGGRARFIGVDPFDTVPAMQRFAAERGVEYLLLRDPERALADELDIVGYPVTLFIDETGQILRQTGELDARELAATIEELF